jgi:hypothetical protein
LVIIIGIIFTLMQRFESTKNWHCLVKRLAK